ncbi:MAG TPA: type II toxin-antitoxin system death-on-curing family toxin [Bacteroidales bacterium]|jgi:death-on-curing protein|nr:type II toxin-antitoxin system death-on-curing family toxin [Bacteroidales bacterium]
MKMLEMKDIILFHKKLIEKTGGSDGIRDYSLIDSALNRAFASFDGKDLYESIEEKISVIATSMVKNHGFIDGNKRIGIAVMLLLLQLNEIVVQYIQTELIELGLNIASGNYSEQDVTEWIEEHRENKA